MVSSGRGRESERARLGFRQEALSIFAFLNTDHGFRCTRADLNLLTYESRALFVDVYHDPLSYEVGVDLGKLGENSERRRSFALVEFVRLKDPLKAQNFRYYAVVKSEQMRPALTNLADLMKIYAGEVLRGDLSVLGHVRTEQGRFERELAEGNRFYTVRSRASAAFYKGNYAEAAALYESIKADLSSAEFKKLEYSKKRTQVPGSREI